MSKWAYIENIITLLVTFIFCYYISMWGLIILVNLNNPRGGY